MKVTTYGLTKCDAFLVGFKNSSAIRIDMMLDQAGAAKLLHTYMQLQANNSESEVCLFSTIWTAT